jgi:dienelactone hydrolase
MTTTEIAYDVDGSTMVGQLALPEGDGTRPAVLIAHEGNGLDDVQKRRPERFAELGYVAFALDYHGGGEPLASRDEINRRLTMLYEDPDVALRLARAGLDVLLAQPRVDRSKVAAVGYCFGGTLVLDLARSGAELRAVVGFHPGLTSTRPPDATNVTGKVLICVGSADPLITIEQRRAFEDEMHAAGVDWQMHVYGGAKHSFTHPLAGAAGLAGLEYDQRTDERSWRAMVDLLAEAFV